MKRNQKIVVKLMSIATGIMIAATIILTVVGSTLVSSGYKKMNKELLKNACRTFADEIENLYEGDWSEKGQLRERSIPLHWNGLSTSL